jgi:ABC-2 type transport system ATP-binding protein
LAEDFQLPVKRRIKKLSRGQLSAVGVIIGLASRAELTFFDEPYLGLDAVARQLFYDRLVQDYAEHPRTIILSSHLIDEVANLLEHVVVIDRGRIIMDADAEDIRGSAVNVSGSAEKVDAFLAGRKILHRETLGSLASVTVDEALGSRERAEAQELGLELSPVSLQQLVVRKTMAGGAGQTPTTGDFADDTLEARR